MGKRNSHEKSVFINCPFDDDYKPIFDAIIFVVSYCGFELVSAQQYEDSSESRIDKIIKLIRNCQFGIHDISRTQLDENTKLPRFNMPFELGLFIGAKHYGNKKHQSKVCLILDAEEYRYQKFLSDLSGKDIKHHENQPETAIRCVRDWFQGHKEKIIPDGEYIIDHFAQFQREMPILCEELKLKNQKMTFIDYKRLVAKWLKTLKTNNTLL
jgi:hypothetical protein